MCSEIASTSHFTAGIPLKCPNCAHDNPADAQFCQNCGQPLERGCPNCGTPNPDDKARISPKARCTELWITSRSSPTGSSAAPAGRSFPKYSTTWSILNRARPRSWAGPSCNSALNRLATYLTGRTIPDLTSGFRAARAEWLVFIDGDCLPAKDFLLDHWNEREEKKVLLGAKSVSVYGKLKVIFQDIFIGATIAWFAWKDLLVRMRWTGWMRDLWDQFHGAFVTVNLLVAVVLTAYSLAVYLYRYRALFRAAER